ncbi:MAG: gliding motility-associated C-terminal domain-containing protein, partial [Bacteroidetes bacterium]
DTIPLEYSIDNGATWLPNSIFTNLNNGEYYALMRNKATGCVQVYDGNPVSIQSDDCGDCIAEYELELLADGRFQVSVIPDTTWNFPFNVTSTAQVTLVVPTGSFEVKELTNLIPNVVFNDNSIVVAPPENPDFDYISFGLETLGTTNIPYQKGVKVPLFTFKNNGFCTGSEFRLMDNDTDPFAFPNSLNINVGQQLTTTGSGQDARVCVKFPGVAPCIPRVDARDDTLLVMVNTTGLFNVLSNDTSYLNNPMSGAFLAGSSAAHGQATLTSDGTFTYEPDFGFTGTDTIQYVVCEDVHPGTCDIGLITIIVSAANALNPLDDLFQTLVNSPLSDNVGTNDLNPDGNTLTYEVANMPSNGTLAMLPDGSFTYTPNTGFVGFDEFLYKVCDDGFPVVCGYATVRIEVTGSNELLAINDSFLGMMNTLMSGDVTHNDFNPNGGPLSVSVLAGQNVAHGTLTLNADGTFEYLPAPGFAGTDEFYYVICELAGNGLCDTARVALNISAEITALDDVYDLDANSMISGAVAGNDLYPNGITIVTMLVQNVHSGSLTFNADGTFQYIPDAGFAGTDEFLYQICNTGTPLVCDTARVELRVHSGLVAHDDAFSLSANMTLSGAVFPNDEYAAGVSVSATILQNPSHGTLIFDADGHFTYAPDVGFAGTDSFVYAICDGGQPPACDTATVTLSVLSGLMAVDDMFEVPADGNLSGDVTDNDAVPVGVTPDVFLIGNADHGTLILMGDGNFVYIPDAGFAGTDSFMYRICDDNLPPNCDTATVVLEVVEKLVAVTDSFAIHINTTLTDNVLPNDTFPQNMTPTVSLLSDPNFGTVTLEPDGDFVYQPWYNYLGTDFFEYMICQNGGAGCDTATVWIAITATVFAVDDFNQTTTTAPFTGDVTNNDIFGPGIGVTTVTQIPGTGPQHGNLNLQPDGTYTYTPAPGFVGTDMFDYEICSDDVPPQCDTATVAILVMPDGLTAVNDTLYTLSGFPVSGQVLDNDINPAGNPVAVNTTPVTPPATGTVLLNADGTFIYTPPAGFSGTVVFQYKMCDQVLAQNCDVATVFIVVEDLEKPEIDCPDVACENEDVFFSTLQTYPADATFEWVNADYNIIGTTPNLTISGALLANEMPLRVRVFKNGQPTPYSAPCTAHIVEKPNIHAVGDTEICPEDPVALSVTEVPGAQYEWRVLGDPAVLSVERSPVFGAISQTTTYEVTVRLTHCGLFSTDTIVVVLSEKPDLQPTSDYSMDSDCAPAALHLTAHATGTGLQFEWTGPNGFFSTEENPARPKANATYNGTYFVTATNAAGCSATAALTVSDVVDFLPEPIITTTGPVCTGQEIQLLTQEYAGFNVDYAWAHNNALMVGNSSNQLVLQPVGMSDAGYYQVMVKVDECETRSDSFYVEILQSPTAAPAYEMDTPCGETPLKLFANGADFGNAATYKWTGPAGFTSAAADPVVAVPTPAHAGVYTVAVTAENGCEQTASVVVDSIYERPAPALLEVANAAPCAGETLELQALGNYPGDVQYQWFFDNGTFDLLLGVTSAPSFFLPNVSDADAGFYSVVVLSDGCESAVSNIKMVTVLGGNANLPATNSTDATHPACEGESVYLSAGAVIPGATYQWFGPGFNASVPNPVLSDVSVGQSGEYYAIVEKDGCFIYTDTTEVVIAAAPAKPVILAESVVCEQDSVVLKVANPPAGAVSFEFFDAETGIRLDSTNMPQAKIAGLPAGSTGHYFVQIRQNGCVSEPSDWHEVEVAPMPSAVAYGGADALICADISTLQLQATAPTTGYGQWTALTPGVAILNPTDPTTSVQGVSPGENLFVWSLSDGVCENYSADTVAIQLEVPPDESAFAGDDQLLCAQNSISLAALSPSDATGHWSQSPAQAALGVVILQPDDPQSAVSVPAPGEYVFTWALSSGLCEDFSSDEVAVTISELPANEKAAILSPQDTLSLCDDFSTLLEAKAPETGTGSWKTAGSAVILTPDQSATSVHQLAPGPNLFVWSLSSGGCVDYAADSIWVYSEDLLAMDDHFGVLTNDTMPPLHLTLNDTTRFSSGWTLRIVSPPSKGTVEVLNNNEVIYAAYPGAGGTDEFRYMICSDACPAICDMATVRLTIVGQDESNIFVPNTITPNGDQINDRFIIPAVVEYPNSALTIFNRWGNQVYYTSNYENQWEGTFNGEPLPEGVYFYCLVLNDAEKTTVRGYVTIRRE